MNYANAPSTLNDRQRTSFIAFNLTQFFGALNDTVYKQLLLYFLISAYGSSHTSFFSATTSALFVLPFILFSTISGKIADSYTKTYVLRACKIVEVVVMAIAIGAFILGSSWTLYLILFLMGLHATVFSPAKYGILPELFPVDQLSRVNSWVLSLTNVAIITSAFVASLLLDLTHHNFVIAGAVCFLFALVGLISSFQLPLSEAPKHHKNLTLNPVKDVYDSLTLARNIPGMLLVILGNTCFYFFVAYCKDHLAAYCIHSMHLEKTWAGYLALAPAVGNIMGVLLIRGFFKEHIDPRLFWISLVGMGGCMMGLSLSAHSILLTTLILVGVGMLGGMYLVPAEVFIQLKTPQGERGQVLGVADTLTFIAMLLTAALIYLVHHLLNLSPDMGFAVMGGLLVVIGVLLSKAIQQEMGQKIAL